ncbi:MAG TPA: rhamnulokinase family protein, partial [Tepidisphaeraceae bacterium]|nr:rhamnulokinase family protein [Tepidisphaeraceae bacterium]
MATGTSNYLAFDLGAESGRAVLGSLDADLRVTLDVKHRFANPTGRMNGHLHWNLLAQWEELKAGLRKAAGSEAAAKVKLAGIGVDTWGVDFGLVAPSGRTLGDPVHYRDARTDGMMEKVFSTVPREKVFQATGIQFMQLNTLFQLAALREQDPKLLGFAQSLLFMPDLFNYLFTGRRKIEYSIASTSQLYDMRKNAWSADLLGAVGVPASLLGEVVPSGTVIGPLLADVANECGAAAGVPVIAPGCHDTASAVAAVPAAPGTDDWCYISSGTWSLMGVELAEPVIDEQSLAYNYTNEGGVGGRIRFLKNIMGLWLVQECRRHFQRHGYDHTYGELTQMAVRSKPFGPVIDTDYAPLFTPGDMPLKIDEFCHKTGQPTPGTRGEYVRTCLESLALTYRRTLDGLEKMLGRRINVIHIVGGGCQNELLNQMT